MYQDGSSLRHAYTIKDHPSTELRTSLGNARISFSDLNGNGQVDVPTEILQENHYYPGVYPEQGRGGMAQKGPWMNNISAEDNKYTYNGKEMNEDFGLGLYDYGARWYDGAVGRFIAVDPYAERYPSWSPFSYVMNNPINAIDPDGRDVILLVWATGNGGYGHAAVAVSNYKKEYYEEQENGKTVTKSRMVADGTYTYYDLWPGFDNDGDGVSDGISSAGPKDAFSGPIAEYQVFKNLTENDLINGDPSGAEGKAADGVIKLYSGYEEDMEAIDDIESHMKSNKEYTSVTNNCSDLACSGVAEALDRYRWWIEDNGADESAYGINYTTPNSLYKYVRDRINSNSKKGKELRNPGSVIDTKFKKAVIDPAKQQQKGS